MAFIVITIVTECCEDVYKRQELAGMVKASSAIKPASFKSGVVTFDNLELGLYLIVQTKSISGYEKVAPFLVSVPLWDKDQMCIRDRC